VHSYWEFNYTTNWIAPFYELPFTGGLPTTSAGLRTLRGRGDRRTLIARGRFRPCAAITERPGGGSETARFSRATRISSTPIAASIRNASYACGPFRAAGQTRCCSTSTPDPDRSRRTSTFAGPTVPRYAAEVSRVDTDGDGVVSALEGDIDTASDGFADNTRMFIPANPVRAIAVTREINDGYLSPRFAPSQRAWILTAPRTTCLPRSRRPRDATPTIASGSHDGAVADRPVQRTVNGATRRCVASRLPRIERPIGLTRRPVRRIRAPSAAGGGRICERDGARSPTRNETPCIVCRNGVYQEAKESRPRPGALKEPAEPRRSHLEPPSFLATSTRWSPRFHPQGAEAMHIASSAMNRRISTSRTRSAFHCSSACSRVVRPRGELFLVYVRRSLKELRQLEAQIDGLLRGSLEVRCGSPSPNRSTTRCCQTPSRTIRVVTPGSHLPVTVDGPGAFARNACCRTLLSYLHASPIRRSCHRGARLGAHVVRMVAPSIRSQHGERPTARLCRVSHRDAGRDTRSEGIPRRSVAPRIDHARAGAGSPTREATKVFARTRRGVCFSFHIGHEADVSGWWRFRYRTQRSWDTRASSSRAVEVASCRWLPRSFAEEVSALFEAPMTPAFRRAKSRASSLCGERADFEQRIARRIGAGQPAHLG